jgi:hypothetical protein
MQRTVRLRGMDVMRTREWRGLQRLSTVLGGRHEARLKLGERQGTAHNQP